MAKELNKVYEPQAVETEIYNMWQEGGYFHAERDENKKPFTIVMPPAKIFGHGRPLNERFAPSVPPRIGWIFGLMPAISIALTAVSTMK